MRRFRSGTLRNGSAWVRPERSGDTGAWLAVRLAAAHQLAVARNRFEAEVGPLPRNAKPATGGKREAAFIERLGGPARLPDDADLVRIRQILWRAPSTWSPAEVDACRRFLAANAPLRAAADRAAERHGTAVVAARGASPWGPADPGRLWSAPRRKPTC